MKSFKQINRAKAQLIEDIGRYAFRHPQETFEQIARRFGVHINTVSRYARKAGCEPRKQGRKPLGGIHTTKH